MNWEVVPEIFFDLVARVVPGSLLLLTAFLVSQGPERGGRELAQYASTAGFASVLAFALFAYFTAVVLKQVWDFLEWSWGFLKSRVTRKSSEGSARQDQLYGIYCSVRVKGQLARAEELPDGRIVLSCIRRSLPDEGLRLLKIQAEKNLCEVVLPGLIVLSLLDGWFLLTDHLERVQRVWLVLTLVCSWFSCFLWRLDLETLFKHDLCALWRLLEVAGKAFVLEAEKKP